jgi:hypothetical protein
MSTTRPREPAWRLRGTWASLGFARGELQGAGEPVAFLRGPPAALPRSRSTTLVSCQLLKRRTSMDPQMMQEDALRDLGVP